MDNPAGLASSAPAQPAAALEIAPTATSIATVPVDQQEHDRPDARASLKNILADDSVPETPRPQIEQSTSALPLPPQPLAFSTTPANQPQNLQPRPASMAENTSSGGTPEGSVSGDQPNAPSSTNKPLYTANPTTTRRNANGSVSSVYSGNKIRHLKKEDGVPLWRKDIQFDFLKYVFENEQPVFHKSSDGSPGHTFADIYLDAMAKSSKCSKILKDKLLTERPAALNMAMVCLLVNVGRMNTTLNCMESMH